MGWLMLIDVKDITKEYKEGKHKLEILKGISFTVNRGEFISIMGPSGSGKTTLMNILGCLDRPTGGTYHLEGIEITSLSKNELAGIRSSKIGFVFQNFNLLSRFSALENTELPMLYNRSLKKQRREAALIALERVGLKDRVKHLPTELSGGQKQRVAIARALINQPSIVFADEPTGNLDSKAGEDIMSLFNELRNEGVTLILVTHDITIARQTERLIHIKDGKILVDRKVVIPDGTR